MLSKIDHTSSQSMKMKVNALMNKPKHVSTDDEREEFELLHQQRMNRAKQQFETGDQQSEPLFSKRIFENLEVAETVAFNTDMLELESISSEGENDVKLSTAYQPLNHKNRMILVPK